MTGWVSEESGIKEWPMITYGNISNYIMFYPGKLTSDNLMTIKHQKDYSCFKTGWLGQLSHPYISESSQLCVLAVVIKTAYFHEWRVCQRHATMLLHSYLELNLLLPVCWQYVLLVPVNGYQDQWKSPTLTFRGNTT